MPISDELLLFRGGYRYVVYNFHLLNFRLVILDCLFRVIISEYQGFVSEAIFLKLVFSSEMLPEKKTVVFQESSEFIRFSPAQRNIGSPDLF